MQEAQDVCPAYSEGLYPCANCPASKPFRQDRLCTAGHAVQLVRGKKRPLTIFRAIYPPALGIQAKGRLKLGIFVGLSTFLAVSGIYTNLLVLCAYLSIILYSPHPCGGDCFLLDPCTARGCLYIYSPASVCRRSGLPWTERNPAPVSPARIQTGRRSGFRRNGLDGINIFLSLFALLMLILS